jgi:prepilin-type N-terminal cleavage/methylation domain-containing protein
MGRPGFTLTELMAAVAVLLVVLAAVGAMFRTAADVAGRGRAAADVLQETAAIERRIRGDLERLSREGFLVIRCVAVPNGVNGVPLLDPDLAPGAVIRADQLVFFANGVHSIQTLRGGAGADRRAQAAAARVYYGHAFQAPDGPRAVPSPAGDVVWAIDPEPAPNDPIVPWSAGPRPLARVRFQRNATDPPGDYVIDGGAGAIDVTQPPAARWLLVRHAAVLADDGGSPAVYLFRLGRGGFRSTASLHDDVLRHGRVDAVAMGLDDVRAAVGAGGSTTWLQRRSVAAGTVFYPRAERAAPGPHRVDQALTAHVLAGACSSFVVDWTWADAAAADEPQPWFGLDPVGPPGPTRGVQTLRAYLSSAGPGHFPESIDPAAIEQLASTLTTDAGRAIQATGAVVYEAIFGDDRSAPWPSALRITLTLRDPAGRRPAAREVQFVVHLD